MTETGDRKPLTDFEHENEIIRIVNHKSVYPQAYQDWEKALLADFAKHALTTIEALSTQVATLTAAFEEKYRVTYCGENGWK